MERYHYLYRDCTVVHYNHGQHMKIIQSKKPRWVDPSFQGTKAEWIESYETLHSKQIFADGAWVIPESTRNMYLEDLEMIGVGLSQVQRIERMNDYVIV